MSARHPSTSPSVRGQRAQTELDGSEPVHEDGEAGGFVLPVNGLVFEELERDLVRQALDRTGGNQARAARLLGMTRDQMRYRIRKFALAVRPAREPAA